MVDVKSDPFNPKLDKVAAFKLYFGFYLFSPQISEPWEMFFLLFFSSIPFHSQIIEPWEMHALGVGTPHTTHCLADGNVMMGDHIEPERRHYRGVVHCAKSMIESGGFGTLWRGFVPCMLRVVPVNGCIFCVYTAVRERLEE